MYKTILKSELPRIIKSLELVKAKKFGKRIKELRMQMRGSLFAKDYKTATGVGHEHEFEPEIYNEENKTYLPLHKWLEHNLNPSWSTQILQAKNEQNLDQPTNSQAQIQKKSKDQLVTKYNKARLQQKVL